MPLLRSCSSEVIGLFDHQTALFGQLRPGQPYLFTQTLSPLQNLQEHMTKFCNHGTEWRTLRTPVLIPLYTRDGNHTPPNTPSSPKLYKQLCGDSFSSLPATMRRGLARLHAADSSAGLQRLARGDETSDGSSSPAAIPATSETGRVAVPPAHRSPKQDLLQSPSPPPTRCRPAREDWGENRRALSPRAATCSECRPHTDPFR